MFVSFLEVQNDFLILSLILFLLLNRISYFIFITKQNLII